MPRSLRRRLVAVFALVLGLGAVGAATAGSASATPQAASSVKTITISSADYWW